MKTLDVQKRLEFARAGVAVLRALAAKGVPMRYKEFGNAIGLIADGEAWKPWYRQHIDDILHIIAATERLPRNTPGTVPLDFDLLVNEKGRPGRGVSKTSKIARS